MSSARKRAAIQKANNEAERLKQKLAVAETMGNVWNAAAVIVTPLISKQTSKH